MQETKKRILVVEDDKNISMLLQFNITTEGYICAITIFYCLTSCFPVITASRYARQ